MSCVVINPAFAGDIDVNVDDLLDTDESVTLDAQDKSLFLKEQKKHKKKKGERNVKVQPSKEDDDNIILELDEN